MSNTEINLLDLHYERPKGYVTRVRERLIKAIRDYQEKHKVSGNWATLWEWRKLGMRLKKGQIPWIHIKTNINEKSYYNVYHESQVVDVDEREDLKKEKEKEEEKSDLNLHIPVEEEINITLAPFDKKEEEVKLKIVRFS